LDLLFELFSLHGRCAMLNVGDCASFINNYCHRVAAIVNPFFELSIIHQWYPIKALLLNHGTSFRGILISRRKEKFS
jgi:hypothetical protein